MNRDSRGIIIVTTDYSHELIARVHHIVNYLRSKNVPVFVVRYDFANYPDFIHYFRSLTKMLRIISHKQERLPENVITLMPLPGARKGICRTLLNALSFCFNTLLLRLMSNKIKGTTIVGIGPVAAFASFVSFSRKHIFVYEDTDFWPALSKRRLHSFLISLIEGFCLKKGDAVISNSMMLHERAKFQNQNAYYISNGVDITLFNKVDSAHKRSKDGNLVYIGSLQKWVGLELVVNSLPILLKSYPNLTFKLSGVGSERLKLETIAKQKGVQDHLIFLGRLPYEQLSDVLANSDIAVSTFATNEFNYYATPLKLLEYMASGVPVIAADWGETARIVTESNAGLLIEPNEKDFAHAAVKLLGDSDFWKTCSASGKDWVLDYDWQSLLDRWLGIVLSLDPKRKWTSQ